MIQPIVQLLRDPGGSGFPADYVVARIRGRRARLLTDWHGAVLREPTYASQDESIWSALLDECAWLYGQLDPELRGHVAPLLALFELKTIVLCLRNRAAQRLEEVERLLRHSLMSEGLQQALRTGPDLRGTVTSVAAALEVAIEDAAALEGAYAGGGLQGFERELNRGYLVAVTGATLHPATRRLVELVIDLRNVMTAYKHLRWQVDEPVQLVHGGRIALERLTRLVESRDLALLAAFAAEVTGRAATAQSVGEGTLETALLSHVSRELRSAGRVDGAVAVVLDYAWRVYVNARNRSIIAHGAGVERGLVERELVA
jgi:vacuolar-type H+-ATPase subunit C/Vma6